MFKRLAVVGAFGLLVAAPQGGAQEAPQGAAAETEAAFLAAERAGASSAPCGEAIGMTPARRLAQFCRHVSDAAEPPCSTTDQCSAVVEHVRYICQYAPKSPLPCAEWTAEEDWAVISQIEVR